MSPAQRISDHVSSRLHVVLGFAAPCSFNFVYSKSLNYPIVCCWYGCRESCRDVRDQDGVYTEHHQGPTPRRSYGKRPCNVSQYSYQHIIQTPIVSLSATQSTLLSQQVYLTDKIDNIKRDRMPHLKCVCFLRPMEESLSALERELREPKYGEYYLCQSVNKMVNMTLS